jgi:hypothetical protein
VVKHLNALRICHLVEWDVLVFIYHHGTSLASAEKISHLLGYRKAAVSAALASLDSKGLLQRSRDSCGIRLYQIAATFQDDSRRYSLEELMNVAGERKGRLLVISHLQHGAGAGKLRLWLWFASAFRR